MKDAGFLLEPPRGKAVRAVTAEPGPLWDELCAQAGRGLQVRFLRGARMATLDGLFAEFTAALQFPPYASATLDGLDECLNDLEWLPAGPLALVVLDAPRLLSAEAPAARTTLLKLLEDTAQAWAQGANGAARPLHVLLQS